MQIVDWNSCTISQQQALLKRPAITIANDVTNRVKEIIQQVVQHGDEALIELTHTIDKINLTKLAISKQTLEAIHLGLPDDFKQAINIAYNNIMLFHQAQQIAPIKVETQPGVICQQVIRPIKCVGLYVPGGSAPLISTVLMLTIPAKIAGCRRIVLCSPPPITAEILYTARLCGVEEIYQLGGAQAIAAMAFGTETIAKVDKIFGPGNAYVTEAKKQVSQSYQGAAIDMPAGPSEVLIIADQHAKPKFIAADLLSQAEHGQDSQVVLLTPDPLLAQQVFQQIQQQQHHLPRHKIIQQCLSSSQIIITRDLAQCFAISNDYAPEHLIIQIQDPEHWYSAIENAGSVFIGDWSPESAGDYASGTNHVLPTYGYAKTYSSLGLADFQKRMTFQQLSAQGLLELAPTLETLAKAEQLVAHQRAVSIRIATLKEQNQ